MIHPIRFGIITIQNLPWATLVEHWKHIEALGYDSVWVGDHFLNPHAIEEDWFDGWTLLAAMATQTSTIRIGTLVTNIIYRNPALIARQAQTLDHIYNGRLELGIGATSERDPSHRMMGIENWSTNPWLSSIRVKEPKRVTACWRLSVSMRVRNFLGLMKWKRCATGIWSSFSA